MQKELTKLNVKDCECFLKHESVKDNLRKYKCQSCNKDYSNKLDEELEKVIEEHIKVF